MTNNCICSYMDRDKIIISIIPLKDLVLQFQRVEESKSVLASNLVLFLTDSFPKKKEKGKRSF